MKIPKLSCAAINNLVEIAHFILWATVLSFTQLSLVVTPDRKGEGLLVRQLHQEAAWKATQ